MAKNRVKILSSLSPHGPHPAPSTAARAGHRSSWGTPALLFKQEYLPRLHGTSSVYGAVSNGRIPENSAVHLFSFEMLTGAVADTAKAWPGSIGRAFRGSILHLQQGLTPIVFNPLAFWCEHTVGSPNPQPPAPAGLAAQKPRCHFRSRPSILVGSCAWGHPQEAAFSLGSWCWALLWDCPHVHPATTPQVWCTWASCTPSSVTPVVKQGLPACPRPSEWQEIPV